MRTFGELLRLHRTNAHLSQEALAQAAGLTVVAVYALERNACVPRFDSVLRLTAALGLRLRDFEDACLPNDGRGRTRDTE